MSIIPKRFRARWAACWRSGLVGAALAGLLGLMVSPDSWLGALSYDLPLLLRGRIKTDEAVIIAMDQRSYDTLAQPPPPEIWNRALHGQLLDRVLEMGARAVVFDIDFHGPSKDPAADARLAEALRRANGRVVLAALLTQTLEGQSAASTNSLGSLVVNVQAPSLPGALDAPWGLADLPLDPDRRVRRHFTNATYVPLAWRAAEIVGRAPPEPLRPRWINFYGPPETLPHVSYCDVLHGNDTLAPDVFSDKVVFIGLYPVLTAGGKTHDEFETPRTRAQGSAVPGVELQATIFLNLLRLDWLNQVPSGIQHAMLAACGLVFGFGLVLLRPWLAVPAALAGATVVFLMALALFWQQHLWFPWMIIVAVQIPCAFAWSVVAHTQWLTRENADLERKLATSLLAAAPAHARLETGDSRARVPVVPDHTLLRRVAQGSYGEVWLARDLVGNYRAVKAIYRDRFPRIEPFEREFRGMQKYSPISRTHPGWLDILHVGRNEAEGCFFYIMEAGDDQVSGQTIDPDRYVPRSLAGDLSRQGKLPADECLRLGLALSDAMAHLHRHGLIHRDIKPSNVIFVNGVPKFADIGLVTEANETGRNASLLGTEGYIAPEGPGSPLGDLFSLGKLLYEIATGHDRRVFPEMPTSLIEGNSDPILDRLYQIILKACEFEPRYRYQSAEELQTDLLQLLQASPTLRKS